MMTDDVCGSGGEPVLPGLPAAGSVPDPFVLLTGVLHMEEGRLVATCRLDGRPWVVLEAAAQAACLHQRHGTDFADRVFLLAVDEFELPAGLPTGEALVEVRLLGQASRSARYAVGLYRKPDRACAGDAASGHGHGDTQLAAGILSVGHAPYTDGEQARTFSDHYRKMLQCLLFPEP